VSASASAAAAAAPAGPSQPTAMDLDAFMTDEERRRKRQEDADHALAMQLMREINAGADQPERCSSSRPKPEMTAKARTSLAQMAFQAFVFVGTEGNKTTYTKSHLTHCSCIIRWH